MIDAHVHLWDPAEREYPWMGPAVATLDRRYDLDDLRGALASSGVTATVLVQATGSVEETTALLDTAGASDGLIAGVVGWVDLQDPALPEGLAALRAGPHGALLRGVRHQVEDEPDPAWLERPAVLRGLHAVADAGLTFDVLVRPDQLASAARAVAATPGLRAVLDHGGKPPLLGDLDAWWRGLDALAAVPGVACKLSGMGTLTDAQASWDAAAPWADALLRRFGPERCMAGSDWPVCTLTSGHADALAFVRAAVAGLSADERAAVLGGNAAAFYGVSAGA
jgi:L-fuconolactonase